MWVRHLLVLLVGVLPGFFLAFRTVFSDVGADGEIALALALILAAYAILGGAAGWVTRSWRAGLWLALPAVVMVGLYSVREFARWPLHLAVVCVALAASAGGACGGVRLQRGRAGR